MTAQDLAAPPPQNATTERTEMTRHLLMVVSEAGAATAPTTRTAMHAIPPTVVEATHTETEATTTVVVLDPAADLLADFAVDPPQAMTDTTDPAMVAAMIVMTEADATATAIPPATDLHVVIATVTTTAVHVAHKLGQELPNPPTTSAIAVQSLFSS